MDKLYIPGDLVMVKESALRFAKDKIFKVISSLSSGFVKVVMLNDSSTTYSISNNSVRPIPLTPEFLKKNGWKKFKRPYSSDYCYRRKDYPTLNIRSEKEVYFHWGDHDKSIITIHQLQHILFGLGINHEMEV